MARPSNRCTVTCQFCPAACFQHCHQIYIIVVRVMAWRILVDDHQLFGPEASMSFQNISLQGVITQNTTL